MTKHCINFLLSLHDSSSFQVRSTNLWPRILQGFILATILLRHSEYWNMQSYVGGVGVVDSGSVTIIVKSVTTFRCIQVWSENQTAWRWSSFADSLNHPVLLAEGTAIVLLHPKRHAAVMEGVVALSPHNWKTETDKPWKIKRVT